MLLNLAFLYEIHARGKLLVLCPVYVLSRCVSAICAVSLPNARRSGMLSSYTKNTHRKTVNITMALLAIFSAGVMLCISPKPGLIASAFGALWIILYCRMAKKQFGGVTGDTAGFFLQMFELVSALGVLIGAML